MSDLLPVQEFVTIDQFSFDSISLPTNLLKVTGSDLQLTPLLSHCSIDFRLEAKKGHLFKLCKGLSSLEKDEMTSLCRSSPECI